MVLVKYWSRYFANGSIMFFCGWCSLYFSLWTIPHLFLPPPPNVFWLNLMETIKGNLTSNRRKLAPGASQRGPLTFLPRRACAQNSKWVPDHLHPKWSATLFFSTLGWSWKSPSWLWVTSCLLHSHPGTRSFNFLPSSENHILSWLSDILVALSPGHLEILGGWLYWHHFHWILTWRPYLRLGKLLSVQ